MPRRGSLLYSKLIASVAVAASAALPIAANAGTYYKLGSDAANKTSFSGTYSDGGTKIGWTDSRSGTTAVTPTDIANSDFIVITDTVLRPVYKSTSQTFPGKSLTLETGGQINAAMTSSQDHTITIGNLVGAGGRILFNADYATTTFAGAISINSGSCIEFRLYPRGAITGRIDSTITGDDTSAINLRVYNRDSNVKTLQLSNAAGFYGKIADISDYTATGDNSQKGKFHLKLTGGFGGSIESLPKYTQRVTVNYDGLPSDKGLSFSATTIHDAVKTGVVFYASSTALLQDGLVLMTFPSGTSLDASEFTVKYAGTDLEDGTAYAHLKTIDNSDGTVSLAVSNEGDFPEAGDTIDLAGASRTIPADWLRLCRNAFTVTDTVGGGEAHFSVPSGVTVVNTNATLTGKLKFVKDGEGTFISAIEQTYIGGNLIAAGVAMPPKGGGTSNAYMPSNGWKGFGNHAAQDVDAAVIRVNTNGVFDINGVYGFCKYKIILNGGTLRNSVAEDYYKSARPGVVIHSLEADSFADFQQDTRYWDGTAADTAPCNLNGFTLKLSIGSERNVGVSSSFTNGTLEYLTGGFFYPVYVSGFTPSFIDMTTVHFVQSASLNIGTETRVRDYTCEYTGSLCSGTAALKVFGTFTPVSQKFYGATMQDGSAIDLSAKEGAFSTTSGFSAQKLKYAADATITVLTGARVLTSGEKLISWAAGAEPDSTVKFVPQPSLADKWRFVVQADGVYAKRKPGFIIIVM